MKLRDHPLLSCRKIRTWPPSWKRIGGEGDKHPKGEVGTLKQVKFVDGPFVSRCFLWIEHEEGTYLGCVLLSDASFGQEVSELLQDNYGQSLEYIGCLNISYSE
jgi:hypothetical protein